MILSYLILFYFFCVAIILDCGHNLKNFESWKRSPYSSSDGDRNQSSEWKHETELPTSHNNITVYWSQRRNKLQVNKFILSLSHTDFLVDLTVGLGSWDCTFPFLLLLLLLFLFNVLNKTMRTVLRKLKNKRESILL